MNYPKIIHLIGGEKILITEEECEALKKAIKNNPTGFVDIQNNLINKTSIAYIGNHHATEEVNRLEEYQKETDLKIAESEIKRLN